jgi:hypothetical protein
MRIRDLERNFRSCFLCIACSRKEDNRGYQTDAANSHSATGLDLPLTVAGLDIVRR